jgi:hypothetical protein
MLEATNHKILADRALLNKEMPEAKPVTAIAEARSPKSNTDVALWRVGSMCFDQREYAPNALNAPTKCTAVTQKTMVIRNLVGHRERLRLSLIEPVQKT